MIDHNTLIVKVRFNPCDGSFTRINSRLSSCIGRRCDSIGKNGYSYVSILNRAYLAHRLAWFYVYGYWPIEQIDHINGDKSDNRIENLRLASNTQNQHNQKSKGASSGLKGVSWSNHARMWRAHCTLSGKFNHLGYFNDKLLAWNAVCKFREDNHREFVNNGKG